MTPGELERVKLYGLCSAHGLPRELRRTETGGGVTVELTCPACGNSEPWALETLLRG